MKNRNHTKRCLSILLSIAMIASLLANGSVVRAAEGNNGDGTGTNTEATSGVETAPQKNDDTSGGDTADPEANEGSSGGGSEIVQYTGENGIFVINDDRTYEFSGSVTTIVVESNCSPTIYLKGATIDARDSGAPAIWIKEGATVNLQIEGENTLYGGTGYAAICVEPAYYIDDDGKYYYDDDGNCYDVENSAKLSISGAGTLTATGGDGDMINGSCGGGAGIGGNGQNCDGYMGGVDFGIIEISEEFTGTIIANGGKEPGKSGYIDSVLCSFGGGAGIGSGGFDCANFDWGIIYGRINIENGTILANDGLEATGVGAGIGSGSGKPEGGGICYSGVSVVISGGNITAQGGVHSAGIGGGNNCDGGDATISGGNITAQGGALGAGIGGGNNGDGGHITITDGKVVAKAGDEEIVDPQGASGIGGGSNGSVYEVKLTGGEVTAVASGGSAGIGGGTDTNCSYVPCGEITISGGDTVVNAYGGTDEGRSGTFGGAGIGAGYPTANNGESVAFNISIIDGATVNAYGGYHAQAIGYGYRPGDGDNYYTGYGIKLELDDTISLLAINDDYFQSALADVTKYGEIVYDEDGNIVYDEDSNIIYKKSSSNYLVSYVDEEKEATTATSSKANGYLELGGEQGTESAESVDWSYSESNLSINGYEVGTVENLKGNWTALYPRKVVTIKPISITAYEGGKSVNGNHIPQLRFSVETSEISVEASEGIENNLSFTLHTVSENGEVTETPLSGDRIDESGEMEDTYLFPLLDADLGNIGVEGKVDQLGTYLKLVDTTGNDDSYAGVYAIQTNGTYGKEGDWYITAEVKSSDGTELATYPVDFVTTVSATEEDGNETEVPIATVTVRKVSDEEKMYNEPENYLTQVVGNIDDISTSNTNQESTDDTSTPNTSQESTAERKAYALFPENTEYLTNGESSLGLLGAGENGYTDEAGDQLAENELIALLFDDMTTLSRDVEDLQSMMMALAKENGITTDGWEKEYRYLDLVNANDGNIVITANKEATVYWPYPEGMTFEKASNYDFQILHYTGMNRENIIDGDTTLANAGVKVESIKVTATEYGLQFTTKSFSPFVLMYKQKDVEKNTVTLTLVHDQSWKETKKGTPDVTVTMYVGTEVDMTNDPYDWYEDSDYKTLITAPFIMTEDKTIYAKEKPVTVTLTLVYDPLWSAIGVGTPDVTYTYVVGDEVDMSKVDGTHDWYEDAEWKKPITEPFTMTENKTIYTKGTISGGGGDSGTTGTTTIWLSYNSNGGSYIRARSFTEPTDVDFEDKNYIPTREGYTFTGWYKSEDDDSSVLVRMNGTVTVSTDMNVIAGWVKDEVTLTLVYDEYWHRGHQYGWGDIEDETKEYSGGTTVDVSTLSENVSQWYATYTNKYVLADPITGSLVLNDDTTIYAGYKLTMVYDQDDNSKNTEEYYPSGKSFRIDVNSPWVSYVWYYDADFTKSLDKTFVMPAANTTVYAGHSLTRVYDQNDDSKNEIQVYKIGDIVDLTNSNYIWYSDAECTEPITSVTMDANKTIYAGATLGGDVTTFHLTYVSNGGAEFEHKVREFTKTTEVDFEDPEYIPTREGYVFTGWYADEATQTEPLKTLEVSEDMTVYAGWKETAETAETVTLTLVYDQVWHALQGSGYEGTADKTYKYEVGTVVDMSEVDGSYKWYDDANFDEEHLITEPFTMNEDKTVYAGGTISGSGGGNNPTEEETKAETPETDTPTEPEKETPAADTPTGAEKETPAADTTIGATKETASGSDETSTNQDNRHQSSKQRTSTRQTQTDTSDTVGGNVSTGDQSNVTLWFTVLLLSCIAMVAVTIYKKKRR